MNVIRCEKTSFSVIGKEGSTSDGAGFIQRLWDNANASFSEVQSLAKRDSNGKLVGIWGVMSDFTRSFLPWVEFSQGLYLAGIECEEDAVAPKGWVKWTIPGYEYICVENEGAETFSWGIEYLREQGIALSGAVHDFTCPQTGKNYMFFPIRKL